MMRSFWNSVVVAFSCLVVADVWAWGGLFNRWNPALVSDLGYTAGHGGGFGTFGAAQDSKVIN